MYFECHPERDFPVIEMGWGSNIVTVLDVTKKHFSPLISTFSYYIFRALKISIQKHWFETVA